MHFRYKYQLLTILFLFVFQTTKSQVATNFELLPDSSRIEGAKGTKAIFEGKVYSFYWQSNDTLVDISFKSKEKESVAYNLILNTNVKDTLSLGLSWANENKEEIALNVNGQLNTLKEGKAYAVSFNGSNPFVLQVNRMGMDKKIDMAFGWATGWFVEDVIFYAIPFSDTVKVPWVLIVLVLGALYFTLYFKFINVRGFFTSINIVRGKHDDLEDGGHVDSSDVFPDTHEDDLDDNPKTIRIEGEHEGEVSHFQALTAALSATVGLGNIAGVAVALSLGGPGATFWMIVAGLIGMSSKFVECTLGVKYREIDKDGVVYGGPMYYLKNGVKGNFGKILAVVFAIMCIGGSFGGGNMFQANQAFEMFRFATGGSESFVDGYGAIFGLIMAGLVGIVIIGGIKKIANVTEKIVPFMVAVYALMVIAVLIMKIDLVPKAFGQIFTGAFTWAGITGGFIGILIQGFQRAAFSNEAGIGSASIAHSAVKTKHAASEGLVALLEPFIDTVVVCTMTALVLIVSNMGGEVMEYGVKVTKGVEATSAAFALSLGSISTWILAIAVILFAFSSMISWSYYGFQAWSFLFGKSKVVGNAYKIVFCLFVIIGGASSLGSVIGFSDAMIFAMLVPNMIGLFFLAPQVNKELKKYLSLIKAKK